MMKIAENISVSTQSVISASDCYAEGLPFESGILPLLKHKCGKRLLAALLAIKRAAGLTPEGMYNTIPPLSANWTAHLWLWNPEMSQEVQNRGFSGPIKRHVSTKIFLKN